MARYDVVDEADFAATVGDVWRALIAEFNGQTHWWAPYWRAVRRGQVPMDQVGGTIDITIQPLGERRTPLTPRFASRVVTVEPERFLRGELFEGWFVGTIDWRLRPTVAGTHLSVRYRVRTNRIGVGLLAVLVDMGEGHSQVMRKGFAALERHLRSRAIGGRVKHEQT